MMLCASKHGTGGWKGWCFSLLPKQLAVSENGACSFMVILVGEIVIIHQFVGYIVRQTHTPDYGFASPLELGWEVSRWCDTRWSRFGRGLVQRSYFILDSCEHHCNWLKSIPRILWHMVYIYMPQVYKGPILSFLDWCELQFQCQFLRYYNMIIHHTIYISIMI